VDTMHKNEHGVPNEGDNSEASKHLTTWNNTHAEWTKTCRRTVRECYVLEQCTQ
jgi:hypothetical protein